MSSISTIKEFIDNPNANQIEKIKSLLSAFNPNEAESLLDLWAVIPTDGSLAQHNLSMVLEHSVLVTVQSSSTLEASNLSIIVKRLLGLYDAATARRDLKSTQIMWKYMMSIFESRPDLFVAQDWCILSIESLHKSLKAFQLTGASTQLSTDDKFAPRCTLAKLFVSRINSILQLAVNPPLKLNQVTFEALLDVTMFCLGQRAFVLKEVDWLLPILTLVIAKMTFADNIVGAIKYLAVTEHADKVECSARALIASLVLQHTLSDKTPMNMEIFQFILQTITSDLLDNSDARLLAFETETRSSIFSVVRSHFTVWFCRVISHGPSQWPTHIEPMIWSLFLSVKTPTTWMLILDVFDVMSRESTQSRLFKHYVTVLVPEIKSRLRPYSMLQLRLRTFQARFAQYNTSNETYSPLLFLTCENTSCLSNEMFVSYLDKWSHVLESNSFASIDDDTICGLILMLSRLWNFYTKDLEQESVVQKAVLKFTNLYLILNPIITISLGVQRHRAKVYRLLEILHKDMVDPVLSFVEGLTGALEQTGGDQLMIRALLECSKSLVDVSICLFTKFDMGRIERLLATFAEWCDLGIRDIPLKSILTFIEKSASRRFKNTIDVSKILEHSLQSTNQKAIVFYGCQALVKFSSVSSCGVPSLSASSRQLVQNHLKKTCPDLTEREMMYEQREMIQVRLSDLFYTCDLRYPSATQEDMSLIELLNAIEAGITSSMFCPTSQEISHMKRVGHSLLKFSKEM